MSWFRSKGEASFCVYAKALSSSIRIILSCCIVLAHGTSNVFHFSFLYLRPYIFSVSFLDFLKIMWTGQNNLELFFMPDHAPSCWLSYGFPYLGTHASSSRRGLLNKGSLTIIICSTHRLYNLVTKMMLSAFERY